MATSFKESEKTGPDRENSCKYLGFGEKKIVKIGPVDTEIHKIFTRYRGIICSVNSHIEVAISHSVLD